MRILFNNLIRDESGVTAIEYALIAALIAVDASALLAILLGEPEGDAFLERLAELGPKSDRLWLAALTIRLGAMLDGPHLSTIA